MKVYKFGGAALKDAQALRNMKDIVANTCAESAEPLVIVVSAMGKTTNQLEQFTQMLYEETPYEDSAYDCLYDQVVSTGELQSSRIVSAFLAHAGIANRWIDITQLLRTDHTYRQAKVDRAASERLLRAFMAAHPAQVYVTQGFIGGTEDGLRTTLGREGSDYSAALLANMLDARSVTLWKDVRGIYSADPRKVRDAVLLPRLSYDEATRMAEEGAQVVHPKTFAPLREKHIPLYVKPFMFPDEQGTVIGD